MNYIKLINQFWRHRRGKNLSSITADVYYFLIQECNEQEWKNPFECPNKLIIASIGISESSLTDARNRLKQSGFIDFENGKRNEKAPKYNIFYPVQNGKEQGKQQGKKPGKKAGKDPNIINKLNENQTKLNTETEVSGDDTPPETAKKEKEKILPPKKEKEPTDWELVVAAWFSFYELHKGVKPSFDGSSPKNLKNIIENLKKRAIQKGWEWNGQKAVDTLNAFLTFAIKDKWLNDNFLLSNLERQFDKIITNGKGNSDSKYAGVKQDLHEKIGDIADSF